MPSFAHDFVVQRLVAEGAETSRFHRRLCEVLELLPNELPIIKKRPDAFSIDVERQHVVVHEVVRTSDFDPRDYATLWFYLDAEEWTLEIAVWSSHGGRIGGYDHDAMCAVFYATHYAKPNAGGGAVAS